MNFTFVSALIMLVSLVMLNASLLQPLAGKAVFLAAMTDIFQQSLGVEIVSFPPHCVSLSSILACSFLLHSLGNVAESRLVQHFQHSEKTLE